MVRFFFFQTNEQKKKKKTYKEGHADRREHFGDGVDAVETLCFVDTALRFVDVLPHKSNDRLQKYFFGG